MDWFNGVQLEWYMWVAIMGLVLSLLHELRNFPATSQSIYDLRDRLDAIESENSDLREQVIDLEDQVMALNNLIDEIKNSAFHEALKYGDTNALLKMDNEGNRRV